MKINIRPVAMTQWLDVPPGSDNEDIISYCARVSNPKNQENFQTAGKLLKYCIHERHWSVFTMSNLVMEISAPRDITRQLLRHKFEFQEFSQRYANPLESFDMFIREARLQDATNRQNSLETDNQGLISEWEFRQNNIADITKETYTWALNNGIAKEQARAVLPEGMTMSRLYVNGNLRNWFHYCQVRTLESTQKEHRQMAEMCWEHIKKAYPFLNDIELNEESDNLELLQALENMIRVYEETSDSAPNRISAMNGARKILEKYR